MKTTHSLNLVEVTKIITKHIDRSRAKYFKVKEVLSEDIQNVLNGVTDSYFHNRKNDVKVTRAQFALLAVGDALAALERKQITVNKAGKIVPIKGVSKEDSKEYTLVCELYKTKTTSTCPYCKKKYENNIFGFSMNTCGKSRCVLTEMRENL